MAKPMSERAAWLAHREDPLHEEVTERLLERLEDIKREFPVVLVLGGAHGAVARCAWSGALHRTVFCG